MRMNTFFEFRDGGRVSEGYAQFCKRLHFSADFLESQGGTRESRGVEDGNGESSDAVNAPIDSLIHYLTTGSSLCE
tara:strand:- start:90 stop:317 length:228 start_codon:yes stop_codon:yes gene_type:complete